MDEIDAPLGEALEEYRIDVTGTLSATELLADQSSITIPADVLASLGAGAATIEIRQVGDFAASTPAQTTIVL